MVNHGPRFLPMGTCVFDDEKVPVSPSEVINLSSSVNSDLTFDELRDSSRTAFHQTTETDNQQNGQPRSTIFFHGDVVFLTMQKSQCHPVKSLTSPVVWITCQFFCELGDPSRTAFHHTTEIDNEQNGQLRPTILSHGDFVFLTMEKSQCHPVKLSTSPVA